MIARRWDARGEAATVAGTYEGTYLNPSRIRFLLIADGRTTHHVPLTRTLQQALDWVYGPLGPQPGDQMTITRHMAVTPLGGWRLAYSVIPDPVPAWLVAA